MTTDTAGRAFIAGCEGFCATVTDDNGRPMIGHGHDLQPGESFADGITLEGANALLAKDLAERFEPEINALIPADCTQNQFNALASFAYNLGVASLRTMVAHGWDQIPLQMPRWAHENGKLVDGLLARRNKEATLFLQPDAA